MGCYEPPCIMIFFLCMPVQWPFFFLINIYYHYCIDGNKSLAGLCWGLTQPKLRFMVRETKTKQNAKLGKNRGYLSLN